MLDLLHTPSARRAATPYLALLGCLLLLPSAAAQATSGPAVGSARLEHAVVALEDRGVFGLEVALAPDLLDRLAGLKRVELAEVPLPGGREVDLRLERFEWPSTSGLLGVNGALRPGRSLVGEMTFWSGSVPGEAASDVFFAFSKSGTRGWVQSGGELFHLLARPGEAGGWRSPALSWIGDQELRELGGSPPAGCGTPPPANPRQAKGRPPSSESVATLPLIQARVAVETDWQFYALFNDLDAARTYALTLLGAASLRYWEQAGIVLLPVYVGLYDNSSDPWTTPDLPGATADMLLDEFRQAWDQGAAPVVADLHHFLSSGFADGGEAYLGTVCDGDWSFAVSTGINGQTPIPIVPGGAANWDFYVAAHGIGHNFNAIHTHEYCPTPLDECAPASDFGPCQTQQVCASDGTLMSSCDVCPGGVANITTYFHEQSATDMRVFAEASCLARLHGETIRVSVDSAGVQGNNNSYKSSVSADGRFVAFTSTATNLVPGDTNGVREIFVHDTSTGTTTRVCVDSAGVQGNDFSDFPSISADGRHVAFDSRATNLVPGDTNGRNDIFVHDTLTGTTTRASVDAGGLQGNNNSLHPSISADGRYVAFHSTATNLVPGDTNSTADVFVHDTLTGGTTRVSVNSAGGQANDFSDSPSISADGRYVAFRSRSTNLVPGDTNGRYDTFIHDTSTGATRRVSVDSAGIQANHDSSYNSRPSISGDGRYAAFESIATNLVPGDTNNSLDIFVHDTLTGVTTRVSVDSAGVQGNSYSTYSSISTEGRYVAFRSGSSNFFPGDTSNSADIFVHDTFTAATNVVSMDSAGVVGYGDSLSPSLSADGRYVAFESFNDLVPGDTNGKPDIFLHENLLHPASGTWTRLGGGTRGSLGKPVFSASGNLSYGSSVSLDLENAPPSSTAFVVISNDWQAVPQGQGMLWPQLTFVIPALTDGSGGLGITVPWPPQTPAQTPIYVQFAVMDPTAWNGWYTLSNAAFGISQ